MVDQPVRYEVDPDGKFRKAIAEAAAKVDDLTIPFIQITKSWYQGNKSIFAVTGSSGKYQDYKKNAAGVSKYKQWKIRVLGGAYPMLRGATRSLEKSLTQAGDENAINQIINKKQLNLGTRTEHAPYLQFGTKYMVARPFMFIGAEQQATKEIQQTRRDLWVKAIQDYVQQVTGDVGTWRET